VANSHRRCDAIKRQPDHALKNVRFLPVVTDPDKIPVSASTTSAPETGRQATSHPTIFVRFAAAQMVTNSR
jgi:hypothetical protein